MSDFRAAIWQYRWDYVSQNMLLLVFIKFAVGLDISKWNRKEWNKFVNAHIFICYLNKIDSAFKPGQIQFVKEKKAVGWNPVLAYKNTLLYGSSCEENTLWLPNFQSVSGERDKET